ncbi:MAG TPA: hypothetical protein VGH31_09235 [Acidimicrobiales bacterium]
MSRVGSLWARRHSPVAIRVGLGLVVAAGISLTQLSAGSTSGADTSFIQGTGSASAQAIAVAPTTGGLNYAITLATSIAAYQNAQASSLSETIDLGAIGTSLEAEGCNSSPPTIPKADVPAPVQAESINGTQTVTLAITPDSTTTGIGVGVETATASLQPESTSNTSTAALAIPGGLLSIAGATSSATSGIINGNTRESTASSDIAGLSLDNGTIVLGGLHWSAIEESGATTKATGTFSIGALTIAGVAVPISIPDPSSVLGIINTALSPLGVNIQWPEMTTLSDGTVQISPLTIGIDNNTLGQEVVGANLSKVQTLRDAIVNAALNADCNLDSEITVADIAVGPLAGGGNLNIQLGGASALTTDSAAVNPFGSGTSPFSGTSSTGDSGSAVSLGSGDTGFTPGTFGTTTPTLGNTTPTTATSGGSGKAQSLGPTQKTVNCISLGPAGGGCVKRNAALPIGLIALGVVVALAAWDYLRQRRRTRLAGQEQ